MYSILILELTGSMEEMCGEAMVMLVTAVSSGVVFKDEGWTFF